MRGAAVNPNAAAVRIEARLDAAIEGGRDPTNINTADRDDMKRETAVCRLISTSCASDIVRV
jgi:hypothetical protein